MVSIVSASLAQGQWVGNDTSTNGSEDAIAAMKQVPPEVQVASMAGLGCVNTTFKELLDTPGHSAWWDTWTRSHPLRKLGCTLFVSAMFWDMVQNASDSSSCFHFLHFGELRPMRDSLRDCWALNVSCSSQSQLVDPREVTVTESQNMVMPNTPITTRTCYVLGIIYLFKVLSYNHFIWSCQKSRQTGRECTGPERQGELLKVT